MFHVFYEELKRTCIRDLGSCIECIEANMKIYGMNLSLEYKEIFEIIHEGILKSEEIKVDFAHVLKIFERIKSKNYKLRSFFAEIYWCFLVESFLSFFLSF